MSRWLILACALWCVLLVNDLDKVFTLSFFWLLHFPLSNYQNRKRCFPDVSREKTYSLTRICIILGVFKKFIHLHFQSYQFNFMLGKAELSVASCGNIKKNRRAENSYLPTSRFTTVVNGNRKVRLFENTLFLLQLSALIPLFVTGEYNKSTMTDSCLLPRTVNIQIPKTILIDQISET